ncbi:beta-lactamase domain-containing protein 2-like [Saccoglossus kowalevskii]|uniref:Beta-lactamase domain-containing protein 2-like n=1 Tax=Saccoglossus kowalevskii TaxID=10224 RepID=A0ABM0M964_SACKO|nr:PREDICTED: beta-lactamase domain-containing protein 2-like [Saccoglossus kowalevskii]
MGYQRTVLAVIAVSVLIQYLPSLLSKSPPPLINGYVASGFDEVRRVFRDLHENGLDAGSSFAVYHKGEKVVDLWGGYANYEAPAICVAMAVDRGYLDYDQKVSHYWPDFAQNGKENITLKQLVHHEAGLAVPYVHPDITTVRDTDKLFKLLAKTTPTWEPGTAHGYHAITYGWFLSGVLRHADPKHRTIGQFFKEEVADVFGIDFHIGLPREEYYRVARIQRPHKLSYMKHVFNAKYRRIIQDLIFRPDGLTHKALNFPDLLAPDERQNTYSLQSLEIPSATGIGTARALAKLYAILNNGGEWEGKRLLSSELIKKFTECNEHRVDEVLLYKRVYCHGMLGKQPYKSHRVFGHTGYGGQGAFFDPYTNTTLAFIASKLSIYSMGDDERYLALVKSTYDSITNLEN